MASLQFNISPLAPANEICVQSVCLSQQRDNKLITAHIWLLWSSGSKGPASVDHYLQGVKPQSIVAHLLHDRFASSDEFFRHMSSKGGIGCFLAASPPIHSFVIFGIYNSTEGLCGFNLNPSLFPSPAVRSNKCLLTAPAHK